MNNLSMKIGKINNLSLENKEINNMYWIYSHFKCQKIAENAFPSCFQTRPFIGLTRPVGGAQNTSMLQEVGEAIEKISTFRFFFNF